MRRLRQLSLERHKTGMGFVWLLLILVIGAFVVLGVVMVTRAGSTDGSPLRRDGSKSALEIVQERYARGEISREEYEEMRRALKG